MSLASSALPSGLMVFPVLLAFVGMLLFSTATLAFYIRGRLSIARLQQALEARSRPAGNVMGALLGAVTPFCTCTAVPLFLSMLEVEIPLGPAVSFLLASPTINLGAVVLLLVVFGARTAVFYGCACLAVAIAVGWLLGNVPRQTALTDYLWPEDPEPDGTATVRSAARLGQTLTRRLLPWLVLATATGVLIDVVLPTDVVGSIGRWGLLGIPLAAVLGSIIYADILLLIPIGYALIRHGAWTPTVLTFMLAASGLSVPEIVVLGRIMQPRIVALFAGSTLALYTMLGFGFAWL